MEIIKILFTVRYGPALHLRDFANSEQLLLAAEERVHILSEAVPPPASIEE